MKTIYFNVQAKGGAGKSMLTYMQALKHQFNPSVAFVDLDSATKTSTRQLLFLGDSETERAFEANILDYRKKIEREKLFHVVEVVSEKPFEKIYIDFGAAESEQLLGLFSMDFTAAEFKAFEKELNVRFVFNIVVAGGTAYAASFDYLKRLTALLNGMFELTAYANEFTFQHYGYLLDELERFAAQTEGWIKEVRRFGDIHVDRNSGQLITENIKEGKGIAGYHSFITRIILKRELEKV